MKQYIIITAQFFFNFLLELRSAYWRLFVSKLKSTVKLNLNKEISIHLYTYGDIALSIYAKQPLLLLNRGFEHKTVKKIISVVKPGDIVLDIGANIGVYTILLSKLVGASGKVYAFEPDIKTTSYLKKNLALNNCTNVYVSQTALSDTNEKVSLIRPEGRGDAYNYISKETISSNPSIDSIKLDNFIITNNIPQVNFIKIDIEGAEFLCLNGASNTLKSMNPVIILELNEVWSKRFNNSIADTIIFLSNFGFKLEQYDNDQWITIKDTIKNDIKNQK